MDVNHHVLHANPPVLPYTAQQHPISDAARDVPTNPDLRMVGLRWEINHVGEWNHMPSVEVGYELDIRFHSNSGRWVINHNGEHDGLPVGAIPKHAPPHYEFASEQCGYLQLPH